MEVKLPDGLKRRPRPVSEPPDTLRNSIVPRRPLAMEKRSGTANEVGALAKIYKALPERVVLFDMRRVTEITPEGRDTLLKLVHAPDADQGAAISLEGLSLNQQEQFETGGGVVFHDIASALGALGLLAGRVPEWPARVERPR